MAIHVLTALKYIVSERCLEDAYTPPGRRLHTAWKTPAHRLEDAYTPLINMCKLGIALLNCFKN
jgi:hypothetical protein